LPAGPQRERALAESLELYCEPSAGEESAGSEVAFRWVDVVIVREHRGFVLGVGTRGVPGVVESLEDYYEKARRGLRSLRSNTARKNGRKKIHAIHKATS